MARDGAPGPAWQGCVIGSLLRPLSPVFGPGPGFGWSFHGRGVSDRAEKSRDCVIKGVRRRVLARVCSHKLSARVVKSSERVVKLSDTVVKLPERVVKSSGSVIKLPERAMKLRDSVQVARDRVVKSSERVVKSCDTVVKLAGRVVKLTERVQKFPAPGVKSAQISHSAVSGRRAPR